MSPGIAFQASTTLFEKKFLKKAPDPGSATLVCILTQALGDHVCVAGERLPVEDEGLGGHQQLPQLGIQVLHLHNTVQGYLNIH